MSVFVRTFSGRTLCLQPDVCSENGETLTGKIGDLEGLPAASLSLYRNGRKVCRDDIIVPGECYHALLYLRGGKGGFGSMLRMLGAQIDKTTNHDACRDLSGRRMRDVNNEKKLSEWINKKAEKEQERQEKRREKLERLRHEPRHFFVDPSYDQQKQEVIENLDDAITQGIQAAATVSTGASSSGMQTVKRKAEASNRRSKKRSNTLWIGVEKGSESEDSEDEDPTKTTVFAPEVPTGSESSSSSTPSTSRDSPSDNTTKQEAHSETDSMPNRPEVCTASLKSTETGHSEAGNALLHVLPAPMQSGNGSSDDCHKAQSEEKPARLDLDHISSVAELKSHGLDVLKSSLMALGMKCGGTLQERAERLYSVKGVSPDKIDPSLLAKPSKGKKAKGKARR